MNGHRRRSAKVQLTGVPVSEIGEGRFFLSEGELFRVLKYEDGCCEAAMVANVRGEYAEELITLPLTWKVGKVEFRLL